MTGRMTNRMAWKYQDANMLEEDMVFGVELIIMKCDLEKSSRTYSKSKEAVFSLRFQKAISVESHFNSFFRNI